MLFSCPADNLPPESTPTLGDDSVLLFFDSRPIFLLFPSGALLHLLCFSVSIVPPIPVLPAPGDFPLFYVLDSPQEEAPALMLMVPLFFRYEQVSGHPLNRPSLLPITRILFFLTPGCPSHFHAFCLCFQIFQSRTFIPFCFSLVLSFFISLPLLFSSKT